MMCDDLRTAIQDYLQDYCNIETEKTESLAEGLDEYLAERGWIITDNLPNKT
jgi:hypothetical protein